MVARSQRKVLEAHKLHRFDFPFNHQNGLASGYRCVELPGGRKTVNDYPYVVDL